MVILNKLLIPVLTVRSHIIPLGGLRPLIRSWSRDTAFSFGPLQICDRPCAWVQYQRWSCWKTRHHLHIISGGILCSALSLWCLGRRRRKLNDVGLLKGDNVLLGSTTHKAGKKRFLFPRHKSSGTIQVSSPSLQVRLRKLGCLRGRVHAEVRKHVHSVREVGGQGRWCQCILCNQLSHDITTKQKK